LKGEDMCLQDVMIWRSCTIVEHPVVAVAAGDTLQIPPKEDRIGFYVTGPETSSLFVQIKSPFNRYNAGRITSNSPVDERFYTIFSIGPLVREFINIDSAAAQTYTVWEYLFPINPEQAERFAKTGKF